MPFDSPLLESCQGQQFSAGGRAVGLERRIMAAHVVCLSLADGIVSCMPAPF